MKGMKKLENIIDSIIDIDKTARNKVSDAKKKASEILDNAVSGKDKLRTESRNELNKEIEERCGSIRENSDRVISLAEEEAEKKCRLLEEIMDKGRESWKSEIVGRITGR